MTEVAHATGIESVGKLLKRGFCGVCRQWGKQFMRRYVYEFAFRLNEGNVWNCTMVRADHIARNKVEKQWTCEELTR
ncbi:MAG: hypothetical protein OXK78_17030 [Caldilineaceae bacterium]|nr:hypothetical protein [Caldilineaceae bacterium]